MSKPVACMREDKIMSKLDALYNKYGKEFYFVFDWELSEEEMQQLRLEANDPNLQFRTSRTPMIEEDENEQMYISIYSDIANIPEDYLEHEIGKASFMDIANYAIQCSKEVCGPVNIFLDPYTESEDLIGFSMEEIYSIAGT